MPETKYYTIPLTMEEAVLIRTLRSLHLYATVTIVKADGGIRRVTKEETYDMKTLQEKFGMPTEQTQDNLQKEENNIE